MSTRNNYVLNKQFREPYVHYTKESYKQTIPDIAGMQKDALDIYKSQSKKLADRFRRNEVPDKTAKEASEVMKTIDAVLNGFIKTNKFKETTENINIFKDKMYQVNKRSFWSYSQREERRKELFEDAAMLGDFVEKLGASLETFRKTSQVEREAVMSALEASRTNIPTKDALSSVSIIKGDSKADIGLKKMIAAVEQLERYAQVAGKKNVATGNLPALKEEEAMEIVRALAGSLNGLKGGFFEIAVDQIGKGMTDELMEEIKKLGGSDGSVKITGTEMAGIGTVTSKKASRKVVSKTDIKMNMELTESGANMDIGLSLKTSTVDKETGIRTATIVSKANYGDLLKRAGAIVDESTYHLANIAAHGGTSTNVYKAAKMKTSALLALEALSGLGDKSDTSYYIMYTDKILNISKFLEDISKGNELPLEANLAGIGSMQADIKSKASKYAYVDRYVRSRETLRFIFDTVKVTMAAKSKG